MHNALDGRCRICGIGILRIRACADERIYLTCELCEGTHVAMPDRPSRELEEQQYRLHRNDPADPGYRTFVSKLVGPLVRKLNPGAEGLDYGCGDGPAGAALLREQGFKVTLYDPIFAPDETALARQYDFVLCCEVAEHFHRPAREFDTLAGLLKPGGWLAVMTSFDAPDRDFVAWHYRRDPTHVAFYRETTFRRLAAPRGWAPHFPAENVVLFQNVGHSDRQLEPPHTQTTGD